MPHDYGDDDQPGFGLRETIVEEGSVNTSGGYAVPGTPFVIAPYRSLAVFVKPSGGGAFSVEVTWDQDGAAGGATAKETKASTLANGETLIFRNHGVRVTGITITGSANTAYAVMPSDVDPLAPSATSADSYPIHEDAPILGLNAGGVWLQNWAAVPTIDTGCVHNAYLPSDGTQGAFVATRFMVGPRYSIHELILTTRTGPDHGQLWGYLASIPEDDPNAGSSVNTNVLQDISTLTFILCFKIETYTPGAGKNFINAAGARTPGNSYFASVDFRPMGAPGTPFTTITLDTTGVLADLDGGPGPYALKIVAGDKAGASTGYKVDLQSVHRHRVDWAFA